MISEYVSFAEGWWGKRHDISRAARLLESAVRLGDRQVASMCVEDIVELATQHPEGPILDPSGPVPEELGGG